MAVLKMNKYTLQRCIITEGYEDEQGDYVAGTAEWNEGERCDIVHNNTNASIVNYEDGKSVSYTYTIYLDKNTEPLKFGDLIRIVDDGMILVQSTIKGFHKLQLQAKAWV